MIKKVYGNCNGVPVYFEKIDNKWSACIVPESDSSKYIIEVFAEDEAGNISYVAKYLYIWDGSQFSATFDIYEWQSDIIVSKYSTEIVSEYVTEARKIYDSAIMF